MMPDDYEEPAVAGSLLLQVAAPAHVGTSEEGI